MNKYYIIRDGQKEGPYDVLTLNSLNLDETTLVWKKGMKDWQKVDSLPELSAALPFNDNATHEKVNSHLNRIVVISLTLLFITVISYVFFTKKTTLAIQDDHNSISDKDLIGKVFRVDIPGSDISEPNTQYFMVAPERTILVCYDEEELQEDLKKLAWSYSSKSKGASIDETMRNSVGLLYHTFQVMP